MPIDEFVVLIIETAIDQLSIVLRSSPTCLRAQSPYFIMVSLWDYDLLPFP